MNRFLCKHYNVVRIVLSVVYTAVAFAVLLFDAGAGMLLGWSAVYVLVMIVVVGLAPNRLLAPSIKIRDEQCDPYPLLREAETLLTYRLPKKLRGVVLMDYCAALQDAGDVHRAYDILHTVNVEKINMPPLVRFVYYNNLASVCTIMELTAQANDCFAIQRQLYATFSSGQQAQMKDVMAAAAALERYRNRDPREAMRLLSLLTPRTRYAGVENAMVYALCALAVGETASAKENFEYVIAYGNRLAIVEKAKALCEAPTQ